MKKGLDVSEDLVFFPFSVPSSQERRFLSSPSPSPTPSFPLSVSTSSSPYFPLTMSISSPPSSPLLVFASSPPSFLHQFLLPSPAFFFPCFPPANSSSPSYLSSFPLLYPHLSPCFPTTSYNQLTFLFFFIPPLPHPHLPPSFPLSMYTANPPSFLPSSPPTTS